MDPGDPPAILSILDVLQGTEGVHVKEADGFAEGVPDEHAVGVARDQAFDGGVGPPGSFMRGEE